MHRLRWTWVFWTILITATWSATPTWSAPGDEFRSDLDIWLDQQNRDLQLRQHEQRLQELESRQRRFEEEQRTRLKQIQDAQENERSTQQMLDFIRRHPYGEGFWESERTGTK